MKVYEITNGSMGFSYVRVYVIAENEEQARQLARARFKAIADAREAQSVQWDKEAAAVAGKRWRRSVPKSEWESYYNDLHVEQVADLADAPLASYPSDEGWVSEPSE